MATSTDLTFGWDLTFKVVEKDIKKKSDILIAFVHWNLTKNGFRCIGIGDENTLTGNEEKSELLPAGWNDSENFVLRYVLDDKLYILHGLHSDGNLIINLMKSEDLAVTNIAVNIEDTVKTNNGPIDKMIPTHKDLIFNIKRDLINPVIETPTTTVHTQTIPNPNQNRPSEETPTNWVPPRRPDFELRDLTPRLPNVGRSDLDPFFPGSGSGMIFQPFQPRRDIENPGLGIPGGLPRGAVPPGARFDPFGPPGGPMPGRRHPPPDADHLPPPGFNDNMFM